jgi:hypothetical protein
VKVVASTSRKKILEKKNKNNEEWIEELFGKSGGERFVVFEHHFLLVFELTTFYFKCGCIK